MSSAFTLHTAGQFASHLAREMRLTIAPSTVQRILKQSGLGRRRDRLGLLEHHNAATCRLLTERTRRQLARAGGHRRHVHAAQPGRLVSLDTFYIGKFKSVGKVWQLTACAAACSYDVAWLMRETLVPLGRLATATGADRRRVRVRGGLLLRIARALLTCLGLLAASCLPAIIEKK